MVSSLVSDLIERQFVRESGFTTSGTGRPSIMLTLNPAAGFIVSCELGIDFILVICTNFAPEIIWRHEERINLNTSQQAIINRALACVASSD